MKVLRFISVRTRFFFAMDEMSIIEKWPNMTVAQKNTFLSKIMSSMATDYEDIKRSFDDGVPMMILKVVRGFKADIGKRKVRVAPFLYNVIHKISRECDMVNIRCRGKEYMCTAEPGSPRYVDMTEGYVMITEDLRKEIGASQDDYIVLEPVVVTSFGEDYEKEEKKE